MSLPSIFPLLFVKFVHKNPKLYQYFPKTPKKKAKNPKKQKTKTKTKYKNKTLTINNQPTPPSPPLLPPLLPSFPLPPPSSFSPSLTSTKLGCKSLKIFEKEGSQHILLRQKIHFFSFKIFCISLSNRAPGGGRERGRKEGEGKRGEGKRGEI